MAQRLRYFLVVWMLMFAGNILGQCAKPYTPFQYILFSISKKDLFGTSFLYPTSRNKIIKNENFHYIHSGRFITTCNIGQLTKDCFSTTANSPSIYYNLLKTASYKPIALFCIAEDNFEKQTSIPLRLRLGSLDYTNYLERKPNALKPPY